MIAKPQHYLVVDDDKTSNLICDLIIRKFDENAKVALYASPEEALLYIADMYSKAENPLPTILFLDVNMPTMTGFEFLDEFKKFETAVQQQFEIYVLSSSIEDFCSQAKQYPFIAGFFSKPLHVSYLQKIQKQNM